jgi:hypothetical protein
MGVRRPDRAATLWAWRNENEGGSQCLQSAATSNTQPSNRSTHPATQRPAVPFSFSFFSVAASAGEQHLGFK